mmetsp:Transcript_41966/g.115782  ORF Transcript_41966/g.115782 Transcript_41966/m.115782 type:complete len:241 (-) Transcript_41966:1035-1757(-)
MEARLGYHGPDATPHGGAGRGELQRHHGRMPACWKLGARAALIARHVSVVSASQRRQLQCSDQRVRKGPHLAARPRLAPRDGGETYATERYELWCGDKCLREVRTLGVCPFFVGQRAQLGCCIGQFRLQRHHWRLRAGSSLGKESRAVANHEARPAKTRRYRVYVSHQRLRSGRTMGLCHTRACEYVARPHRAERGDLQCRGQRVRKAWALEAVHRADGRSATAQSRSRRRHPKRGSRSL